MSDLINLFLGILSMINALLVWSIGEKETGEEKSSIIEIAAAFSVILAAGNILLFQEKGYLINGIQAVIWSLYSIVIAVTFVAKKW